MRAGKLSDWFRLFFCIFFPKGFILMGIFNEIHSQLASENRLF